MSIIHTPQETISPNTKKVVVSGPPALAKVGSVVAAVIATGSTLAWPDPLAVTATILGAIAAVKLARLAVIVDNDYVVVRNLFATSRISVANAEVRRVNADLRTRLAWGGNIIPSEFVPKMDDDNMATDATIIRIVDTTDHNNSAHTDCSIGILPAAQDELFAKLQNAIGAR